MEYPRALILLSRPRRSSRRGVALVLVLMLVALATILITALLLSVQTETKSSRSMLAVQDAQQMADLGQQAAIAQIQQATTQGPTMAWASQPGMIRCYDNTGKATTWYKLYSAAQMVQAAPATGAMLTAIQADVPTDNCMVAGTTDYGVFTDINSPAISSIDGSRVYPIVDPSGAKSVASSGQSVLGFDVQNASPNLTAAPGYDSAKAASSTNNPAAMPVRWLYVLADSTLVAAQPGSSPGQVLVAGATASNPIVGRVAFWTDDETCKLNINTAADGTYYDTPRFASANYLRNPGLAGISGFQRDAQRLVDKQLAVSPPVANEYQRYIGHPAQTRLSYLLPAVAGLDLGTRSQTFSQITPFMQWGGSEAGLFTELDSVPALAPPVRQSTYASVDEWIFSAVVNSATTPPSRRPNYDSNSTQLVTGTTLPKLRFFLSATSEAPEVNLFGQPRISIWPINSQFNLLTQNTAPCPYVTTTDQLIATAATLINGNTQYPYYFTRFDATSQTADYTNSTRNQNIYQFLRTLAGTPIPGYGGSFNSKYQTAEMDQILTEIFDYIRCTNPSDTLLVSSTGTGGYQYSPTAARYSHSWGDVSGRAGQGQVIPISITPPASTYTTHGFGRFFTVDQISIDFTRSQAAMLPGGSADNANTIMTGLIYLELYSPSLGPPDFIPDMRVEIDGLNDNTGTLTVTTNPATPWNSSNNPIPMFGPVTDGQASGTTRTVYSSIPEVVPTPTQSASGAYHDDSPNYWFFWGGASGPRHLAANKNASYAEYTGTLTGTGAVSADLPPLVPQQGNYMFCGRPIKIPNSSTFHFSGGPITIKIYYGRFNVSHDPAWWADGTNNGDGYSGLVKDLVQTIKVTLPAFDAPLPSNNLVNVNGGAEALTTRIWNLNYGPGDTDHSPIKFNDTVRSLLTGYNGDARLIAAQTGTITSLSTGTTTAAVIADTLTQPFVYLPASSSTTTSHVQRDIFPNKGFTMHGFVVSSTGTNSLPGSLLATGTYGLPTLNGLIGDHTTPGSPTTISPDGNGDWDNGPGAFPDGPYINRADEAGFQYANYGTGTSTSFYTPLPYYQGNDGSLAQALTYTSPNRTMASAVTFGSLSTGVPINGINPAPWRTLLFRPQPTHFGATSPEDELLLDWFWMPVVDPYAISTTLATSGKVNMNYQIVPFTYLTRATALLGVLGSENVIAVPTSNGGVYKPGITGTTTPTTPYRVPVRVLGGDGVSIDYSTGSLGQFKQRFDNGEIFKSAAEICDINLVPNPTPSANTGSFDPTSSTAVANFWSNNALTGDNSRERPYNGLYPRLTTKSNTFTIHVRAQALKMPPHSTPGVWTENPQLITSEYRGSVIVNRYLDPMDPNLPDFAASTNLLKYSIDNYYKYRVLETRRFLP